MKKIIVVIVGILFSVATLAGEVGSYPNAAPLGGTERMLSDQSGATVDITPTQVNTYIQANPATHAAQSIPCNVTGSVAATTDCNPLAVANLLSATIAVQVISNINLTLSGTQTIQGVALVVGQTVLASAQTTTKDNGIYVVQSGAWTRAINFPSGYVIAQNCDVLVIAAAGTTQTGFTDGGHGTMRRLLTTGGPITIGTTAQTWILASFQSPQATPSTAGLVRTTDTSLGIIVSNMLASPLSIGGSIYDCVSFQDTTGSVGDYGSGACAYADPNGHLNFINQTVTPVVTGTGCSLAAGTNYDSSGAIVATGVDACTLTFGAAYTVAPHCTVSGVGATVLPRIHALATTALATFDTTAAGTFTYICL